MRHARACRGHLRFGGRENVDGRATGERSDAVLRTAMTLRGECHKLFRTHCVFCFSSVSSRRSLVVRSVTTITSSWFWVNHSATCSIQPYIETGTGGAERTLPFKGSGDGGDHVVILLHAVDYRERDVSADCRAQAGRQAGGVRCARFRNPSVIAGSRCAKPTRLSSACSIDSPTRPSAVSARGSSAGTVRPPSCRSRCGWRSVKTP